MIRKTLNTYGTRSVFTALTALAIFETFAGSTEPVLLSLRGTPIEPYLLMLHNGNSIGFNLAVGFLISVFFWVLVVQISGIESETRN